MTEHSSTSSHTGLLGRIQLSLGRKFPYASHKIPHRLGSNRYQRLYLRLRKAKLRRYLPALPVEQAVADVGAQAGREYEILQTRIF